MTSHRTNLRVRLLQPIESIPSTVLAGLSPSLERRRASVTAASIRPRTGASSDYVLSSLAAQPYDLIYLMKCIYAQPRETKLGEEGDPRQQALYDRILMPIYDVVLHLCPLFADKMIDNRAKFTVVVRLVQRDHALPALGAHAGTSMSARTADQPCAVPGRGVHPPDPQRRRQR